ncbi:MAG: HAD family phosphatase [Verrucomicrobia bacterium]|nr:MAG: HAD family phosphatase [Verrucomicrobiota bacterium]
MSSPGALFDWDGVIIDSSWHHERSWERLAAEEKRSLPPDHFKRGFGMKNEVIIPQLLGWTEDPEEIRRLSLRKEALYREIVRESGIEPLPGVKTFLERLRAAGIPCVIASSTHRENIDLSLAAMGLSGYFRDIVTAEDVSHGKPHPEPFLKAAAKAGRPPEHCVVFEDALTGIEAGIAAGAKVVAVATTNPREVLEKTGAARIVDRLDELEAVDLERLVG